MTPLGWSLVTGLALGAVVLWPGVGLVAWGYAPSLVAGAFLMVLGIGVVGNLLGW